MIPNICININVLVFNIVIFYTNCIIKMKFFLLIILKPRSSNTKLLV